TSLGLRRCEFGCFLFWRFCNEKKQKDDDVFYKAGNIYMATYLCMTMPMAVNHLSPKELLIIIPLTLVITAVFYFILRTFHTANILPSTLIANRITSKCLKEVVR
ncbi:MAG: hypothetical protein K6G30_13960, partial [Acetatifactor sp.]|nr:hypothetical protein [Acetatifactor sp.]